MNDTDAGFVNFGFEFDFIDSAAEFYGVIRVTHDAVNRCSLGESIGVSDGSIGNIRRLLLDSQNVLDRLTDGAEVVERYIGGVTQGDTDNELFIFRNAEQVS